MKKVLPLFSILSLGYPTPTTALPSFDACTALEIVESDLATSHRREIHIMDSLENLFSQFIDESHEEVMRNKEKLFDTINATRRINKTYHFLLKKCLQPRGIDKPRSFQ